MSVSSNLKTATDEDPFNINETEELNLQKCNEIMKQLDDCKDSQQISRLQEKLATDYKDLVSEFANARLKRISELITTVDNVSKSISKNYTNFESSAANKTPGISKKYGTELERPGAKRRRSSASLDNNINNNTNISPPPSPPLLPADIDVPVFNESFKKISAPYVSNLESVKNKYIYQNNLIENKTYSSKNIIWMQFLKQRQEAKDKKLATLNAELNELEYEFKGIRRYKLQRLDELSYRKSKSSKFNSKSLHKKLTKTLSRKLETVDQITSSSSVDIVPMLKTAKIITGLTEDEIDTDLKLMKYWERKEDEPYRAQKQIKIKNARKAVEQQLKESKEKIKQLVEKQKDDKKKSKEDFMKQQEELFRSSQMSAFPQLPTSVPPNTMFPPMFFMPPFFQPPFQPGSEFLPPPPFYPPGPSQQQQQQTDEASNNSHTAPQPNLQHHQPFMFPPPHPSMFFPPPPNFPGAPHPALFEQQFQQHQFQEQQLHSQPETYSQQQSQQQQQQQQPQPETRSQPQSHQSPHSAHPSPSQPTSPQPQQSSAQDQQEEQEARQASAAEQESLASPSLMPSESIQINQPRRSSSTSSNSQVSAVIPDDEASKLKALSSNASIKSGNPNATGEFTTIKDIIAMKDRERQSSSYKRYYTGNKN